MLTRTEHESLLMACATFFPEHPGGIVARGEIDPRVVAAMVAEAIALLDAGDQAELRLLLRLLATRAAAIGLVGSARPLRDLPHERRERALLAMATSPIPQLRRGFQALKRLATFIAYAEPTIGEQGGVWERIGYRPRPLAPTAPPALRLEQTGHATSIDCDICVVGSGAGGAVVAARLAVAGHDVLVLEGGPADQEPDFEQRELAGTSRLFLDRAATSTRDLGFIIFAGACLGGGTTVNWQTSLRTPDAIRDEWAERSGCRHFTDANFDEALDSVSDRIGAGTDETIVNRNNEMLRDGCSSLGWSWATLPRNARGCEPSECGQCVFGCRRDAKQSAAVTFLRDAQASGARIVASCVATRVLIERGRATGVECQIADGVSGGRRRFRVRARAVVVAGGGIESPALLLRSGLDHPQLGRNLYLHPTTAVAGRYPHTIEAWSGPPQSIVCDEYSHIDGGTGFRLETAPAHPGLLALAQPWWSAREHRDAMDSAARTATFIVLSHDRTGGRVHLTRRGRRVIDYTPAAHERRALGMGIAAAARVHAAAGAEAIATLHAGRRTVDLTDANASIERFSAEIAEAPLHANWSPLFSAHQMGTCRMGADPRTSVCDENGEVHGTRGLFVADASAFPAASGVNPMVTVMALAHHVATRLARTFQ